MSGKLAISGTNAGTPSFDFSVESQKNKSVIGGAARPQWMKNLGASVAEWLNILPKVQGDLLVFICTVYIIFRFTPYHCCNVQCSVYSDRLIIFNLASFSFCYTVFYQIGVISHTL